MTSLNHIGIAVADLANMKKLFSILGLNGSHVEKVPEQSVIAHFVKMPAEDAHLEFLEPDSPKSTIAQFLDKRGPGVHHLSFTVEKGKLEGVCEKLRAEGYRLTYDQPKRGAHNMRINFIHPSTAGGILIEVMEPV